MQLEALYIYPCLEPVDMRLGVDGLSRLARDRLKQHIGNGCCYVFSNRSRNRLKVVLWDGTGVWLCQRRLHLGRFTWPDPNTALFEPSQTQWEWLAKGVD